MARQMIDTHNDYPLLMLLINVYNVKCDKRIGRQANADRMSLEYW